MERYFPRGIREDWNKNIDAGEEYYIRMLKVPSEARKYIVAEFLRFVHPFNYFFTPKKACAYSMVCKDIAEYPELIKFVKYKYSELYGSKYSEYLNAIMIDNQSDAGIENKVIDLSYGTDMDNYPLKENNTFESLCTHKDRSSALNIKNKRSIDTISWEIQYAVIFEFLTNSKTSFRKLETDIMGIESKSNGGGFKSKGIINSYGFTVKDKGKLSEVTIDEFINSVEGIKKEVLLKIKNLINNKMP